MDIRDLIANSICRAVHDVFATMLNVELEPGEVVNNPALPEPSEGVVSLIGLAGPWIGTGTIMCSPALACRVCTQMLMTETASVNEEVLDAVGELTNMVIGSVKNDLEKELGPLGLSIPTVIFGRNFKTKSTTASEWVVERFRWDQDEFLIKLCLAKNEKHLASQPLGHTCPVDVKV